MFIEGDRVQRAGFVLGTMIYVYKWRTAALLPRMRVIEAHSTSSQHACCAGRRLAP